MYRKAAIVGIGQTDISADSGRTEWQLALEAIVAALDDAGIDSKEVDGIVRYSYDTITEPMLAWSLGIRNLRFYGEVGYGGIATCAVVAHAAAAIAAGQASVVVVYRSLNERSGTRYGRAERHIPLTDGVLHAVGQRTPAGAFAGPYGFLVPGQGIALAARRYQYEHGLSDEDLTQVLGRIAMDERRYANTNPHAMMRDRELTMDAYRNARLIASPLRLFDYCLESDGAGALVIVDAERAKSLRTDPVFILSANQTMVPYSEPVPAYMKELPDLGYLPASAKLFEDAKITPSDLSSALLYDAFTPLVLLQLESYGLVEKGSGWKYLLEHGIGLDSPLPINMHGGFLSEGYLHGVNHLTEAVRQLRGTAANQVEKAGPILVGAVMMSGLLLDR